VSARGSPAHPRPARIARGLFVRPIGALPDRSPQALVPCCRRLHNELSPSTRAILRDSRPSQTDSSAVVLIRSRPALRPRTIPQQLRATPRQATTPGPPSLRALTRVPSCATRARRALQRTPLPQLAPSSRSKLALFFRSVSSHDLSSKVGLIIFIKVRSEDANSLPEPTQEWRPWAVCCSNLTTLVIIYHLYRECVTWVFQPIDHFSEFALIETDGLETLC